MAESATLDALANELVSAADRREPIDAFSERGLGLEVAEAYEVQRIVSKQRVAAGRLIRGRKVGLTSRAMQDQLGVHEPDFGVLFDDMFVEEGDPVDASALIAPRIEAEIAFVLDSDLRGPGVLGSQVPRAVAALCPAFEIIDSRIADWKIALVDTVADNASSGRVVLGAPRALPPDLDLRLTGVVVSRNGAVVATGAGAAVLGNPLRCIAWLANKLGEFGEGLSAGDVVLAGALHAAVAVEPSDSFRAEFSQLGSVTTTFKETAA